MGYGSVGVDITYQGKEYGVKIYPLAVHTIKAFNARLKINLPKTMNGYKGKAKAIQAVTDFLESREPEDLGGLRIEVSVNAPTLEQACDQVLNTPLLDADFWLEPPEGRETYKMDVKTVSKEGLIGNARWVQQLARQNGFFVGNGSQKPTARHHRVQSDMWSAMGWNMGKRRLTKALDPQAWWWRDTQSEEDLLRDPLGNRAGRAVRNSKVRNGLLKLIRERHPVRHIPCLLHPGEAQHIYQLRTWDPLCLRCANTECFHKLGGIRLWNYLASRGGPIPRSALDDITRPRLQLVVEIPVAPRRLHRRPTRRGGRGFSGPKQFR